ncbi:uncharacterized protein LOC125146058 [Tachysurus fulvidraco]|uniref:uncharacterized protein LOC125146058 n=1 Tax=Tachysurus fulvidraco TaxID=1234273 RepID=UPI001FED3F9C|nr:uncharacterized protein LOC125146058 [Tachysurus fulvidraco]XP_047677706.1 uncharacterized protein LOC125146058 [Tachysurus fulvidraco]
MKMTFQHRQDLVHDPQRSTDVFKTFPRFLDVKGLVNQDFLLLFGAETASKMLEKWDTSFKPKVIKEAKKLTQTSELCRLLKSAEKLAENDETDWDSDIASMLHLLYLFPPTAGRKRTKIGPSDAVNKMVHFHKTCSSINEYVQDIEGKQPYILAVGQTQKTNDTVPSTSPLTNSSSSAKPPAHWVLLMNCLNPFVCFFFLVVKKHFQNSEYNTTVMNTL